MNRTHIYCFSCFVLSTVLLLTGCNQTDNDSDPDPVTASDPQPGPDPQPEPQPDPVDPPNKDNWYKPSVGSSWQWQLSGALNTSYSADVYDVDLFDTSAARIAEIQATGRKVLCYFSAGSWENWRTDKDNFPSTTLGNNLDGWPGEKWLDIRASEIRQIMTLRLDLARQKKCDGIEPDNIDGFTNNTGFNLTAEDQISYNRFIADESHKRGLAAGLKNDLDQVPDLLVYFDFSVNEQCHEYNECDLLEPFIAAGKPVFNAEYKNSYVNDEQARQRLCVDSLNNGFSTLILPLNLDDSFRFSCN